MRQNGKVNVVVVGRFQTGKSTLINCLLDERIAPTGGKGVATTQIQTIYQYGQRFMLEVAKHGAKAGVQDWLETDFRPDDFIYGAEGFESIAAAKVSLWKPLLQHVNLIDTPGIDANEQDTGRAMIALDKADFVLVLLENHGMRDSELHLLSEIRERCLPFSVIVNCRINEGKFWHPGHNAEIVEDIETQLANHGITPVPVTGGKSVWPCNLIWFWHSTSKLYCDDMAEKTNEDIWYFFREQIRPRKTVPANLTQKESNFLELRRFLEERKWMTAEKRSTSSETSVSPGNRRQSSPDRVPHSPEIDDETVLDLENPTGQRVVDIARMQHWLLSRIIRRALSSCWREATGISGFVDAIASHKMTFNPGENEESHQRWYEGLADIVARNPELQNNRWSLTAARSMTSGLEYILRRLAEPYLKLEDDSGELRQKAREDCERFLIDVNMNGVTSSLCSQLDKLQPEYKKIIADWRQLRARAVDVRRYYNSSFIGRILSASPQGFTDEVTRIQNDSTALFKEGNLLLKEKHKKLMHHWNRAFSLVEEILHEQMAAGVDIAPLAYNFPGQVNVLPIAVEGCLDRHIAQLLESELIDPQKTQLFKRRLYCACRRLGIGAGLRTP